MQDAYAFLMDLKMRLKSSRVQLTTDGLALYMCVVDGLWAHNIDYAMLHKIYGGTENKSEHSYSSAVCTGIDIRVITGDPDKSCVSTSYVERQNLTMWMGMRRFTRLTNGS